MMASYRAPSACEIYEAAVARARVVHVTELAVAKDSRSSQSVRLAYYLERHPESTAKEIDAACDTGCVSKVLSEMRRMGYGLSVGWREVLCASGRYTRQVRTYTLLHRPEPKAQADLFKAP
jgi:hypothetical protein